MAARKKTLKAAVEKQPAQQKPDLVKRPDEDSGRVKTGINGLDEMVQGGFERGATILVTGDAGTGKTTFALQFLHQGAVEYDEPGIFVTFEEPKESLYKHAKPFGWDFEKLEKEKKFATLFFHPYQVKKMTEEGGGLIEDAVRKLNAKRIVIDSLTSYSLLFESQHERREALVHLLEMLRKWGCTSMLISEANVTLENRPQSGIEFLTDGVIILYHSRRDSVRVRAIEILKMRGTSHAEKIVPMEFVESKGVFVYPNESVFEKL